jgi:hypothetical protein
VDRPEKEPMRVTQSGVSANRGRSMSTGNRTQGRVYHMTQEEVRAASDVVAGMITLNAQQVYALLDPRATHSFMSTKFIHKLTMPKCMLEKGLTVSTPLGERVDIDEIYRGCNVQIRGQNLQVDLVPLTIQDFDVILGMDWLGKHHATMDCYNKIVTFNVIEGKKVEYKGERKVILGSIISVMTVRKLLRKGCQAYLAYVVDNEKQDKELRDIPIVGEYPDVFPEELSGLPPRREIEFSIEVLPGTMPTSRAPYRMAPVELAELKVQLQELLDK